MIVNLSNLPRMGQAAGYDDWGHLDEHANRPDGPYWLGFMTLSWLRVGSAL